MKQMQKDAEERNKKFQSDMEAIEEKQKKAWDEVTKKNAEREKKEEEMEAKTRALFAENSPDAKPSSLLEQAGSQSNYLTIDGMRLTPSSSLQEEEQGFKALDHVIDNVNKLQAATARKIADMEQDSFFKPLPSSP